MTLAFWNNGTPRIIRSHHRVTLPNGAVMFNAKADPSNDLYEYVEIGANPGRFFDVAGANFDNDGWTITATHTPSLKPLADLQGMRLADLAAHRYAVENGGMVFGANAIPTDDRSKTLIIGARTMAKEDAAYTKDWKVAAGQYVTLDAVTIIAMADALEAHVAAAFANEKLHADSILALTDGQAVIDYNITAGWPANPSTP